MEHWEIKLDYFYDSSHKATMSLKILENGMNKKNLLK